MDTYSSAKVSGFIDQHSVFYGFEEDDSGYSVYLGDQTKKVNFTWYASNYKAQGLFEWLQSQGLRFILNCLNSDQPELFKLHVAKRAIDDLSYRNRKKSIEYIEAFIYTDSLK